MVLVWNERETPMRAGGEGGVPYKYNGEASILYTVKRLEKGPTILDKTTWENVSINVHYLTQQNYFQINGFA